ncbi:uncharacterized protein LOC120797681 [Xiphias gladius]|uniref:uncharacterized protein LOC120797681 n=1 Tax=Xiphias gladius TaxID=8245 RepID=UPI001A9A18B4|nr:uncharacterized protein LOC120797681 [Xiphias gladius]
MDTDFLFEQVQEMRPSPFSEEEWHCYQVEKMMLRQFMLMKQQDQVPDYLSVRDMKTWLLTGRSFLEEFQEEIATTEIHLLFMAELAWTTARHFCLNQMEQELLEELNKEEQLSQLLGRKVTLEGVQMFVSVVRPAAEEEVRNLLPSLHSKLLGILCGIQTTIGSLSAGDTKPTELLALEESTAPLVPEVVETTLKFFLEEPERENKSEAASAEIGKLLANSMDYDQSFFSAREGVISAIQDMETWRHGEGVISAIQEMEYEAQTDDELEVVQQVEVDAFEKEKSRVQDCDVKKTEVPGFFRGLWEMMTCCFCFSTED